MVSDVDDVLSGSRSIDMSIADFVELAQRAAKIDRDANPVSVQENSAEAITQAEKVAVGKLEIPHKFGSESEQVTIYGIEPDSAYFDADVSDGKIVAGTGLSEKCQATIGATISAYDKYENKVHDLTIDEVYGPREDTNIYVSFETFNDLYGYDANYFNAYASDIALNIDSEYLSGDITPEGMQKLADQMQDSMGDFIGLLQVLSIFVFFIIMYLLTKTVIERNSRQIAYLKVFGYTDKEISKLYVRTITLTVLVSLIVSLPIVLVFLGWFCELMFMDYSGNFVLNFPQYLLLVEVAIGFVTYLLVAALHMRHIKRVPLAMALKIQE